MFAGQYQQLPAPQEGCIIKSEWMQYYTAIPENFTHIITSWDTASKTGPTNAYSACITFGISADKHIYLLDIYRDKLEFPHLANMVKSKFDYLCSAYPRAQHKVVIEDASSGTPIIQFLHAKNIRVIGITPETDPRPGLLKKLCDVIGDTGSVVVYHKTFEKGRNCEMAFVFPEFAKKLSSINERILDLEEPFKNRGLYCPCQNGSVSIKKTLPTFVPKLSYETLGIHNGTEASSQFLDFMNRNQTPQETEEMMKNLREYCGQDTLAMVRLLDVIFTYTNK